MALPRELRGTIREIEIHTRRIVDALMSGEYHSAFKGHGLEFAESRPYQPGDDIRAMDWNVTARAGKPFVKVFHEERELSLILMVDLSGSQRFGSGADFKSETAARACALLAFSALRNNDKVGLAVFTDTMELYVPPRKGRAHALRLIREILYFQPRGRGTDIGGALEYVSRVTHKTSIVFLVSDFQTGEYERQLRALSRRHDVIALRVRDPLEETLPDAGYAAIEDAETGERIVVNTSSPPLREEFNRTVNAENERRARMFAAARVDEVVIDTHGSFADPLVKFFRLRERRKRFG